MYTRFRELKLSFVRAAAAACARAHAAVDTHNSIFLYIPFFLCSLVCTAYRARENLVWDWRQGAEVPEQCGRSSLVSYVRVVRGSEPKPGRIAATLTNFVLNRQVQG